MTHARTFVLGLVLAVPLAALPATPAAPAPTTAQAVAVPVSVTSSNSFLNSAGDTVVTVGEVRNDSAVVARQPLVVFELLDAAGNVLDRGEAVTSQWWLLPGATAPFERNAPLPAGWASTRIVSVTAQQGDRVPNTAFEVVVDAVDAAGSRGTVRNTGPAPALMPYVELPLFDPSGVLYEVDGVYPGGDSTSMLAPGASAAWSTMRFSGQAFREGTVLRGQAFSTTPPSPYPTEVVLQAPTRVAAGQVARVSASVRGRLTTGTVPTERTTVVELYGREAGQTALRLLRRTSGNASFVSWDLRPQRDLRLEARVVGNAGVAASTSAQALTQVTSVVTTTTGSAGSLRSVVRGSVRPVHPGGLVQLQERRSGVYRTVASTRLSSTSTYAFTVERPAGQRVFRVHKPAGGGAQAGTGFPTTVSFTR